MSDDVNRYVEPPVDQARVDRNWYQLAERLEARPRRGFRWVALGVALTGAAAFGLHFASTEAPTSVEARALSAEARLQTANEVLAVTLVDGSSLNLAARTELTVRANQPRAVALSLQRGELTCDVAHRDGRSFTVLAGDVEIRVVGTKFSVKTGPEPHPRVEVSVLRGVVEVRSARRPGVVARVAAGQSWTQLAEAAAEEAREYPAPRAGAPTAPSAPTSRAAGTGGAPSVALARSGARELFEQAGERRRAGDALAAARAYEELLRLYPSDARASLSAFELGRLRMDRLGDTAGAAAALERAVTLNVGPSFREDALARLVSVYAAQGNFAACGRARDRYLRSYPAGVHASAVATRCGAPSR